MPTKQPEQGRPVIGYQGSGGAYSHLAAQQHFAARRDDVDYRGYRTFGELVAAVEGGHVDYGMLPVENTTAGSINEAYDLLATAAVAAVGEEVFRVEHCLIALEPIPFRELRCIASHPQALAQCSRFLAALEDCRIESYADTAMAVGKITLERNPQQAAIASRQAARRHGLEVLKSDIANHTENYTRFLVIAAETAEQGEAGPYKTSLVFATLHEKGALAQCLNVLADNDLNLTKLESRPRENQPFQYIFYADFEGNLAEANVATAVEQLAERTSFLKVLGSYPASLSRTASATASVPTGAVSP